MLTRSGRLQNLDFTTAILLPKLRGPTLTPVGLSPTERASLRWTHNKYVTFSFICIYSLHMIHAALHYGLLDDFIRFVRKFFPCYPIISTFHDLETAALERIENEVQSRSILSCSRINGLSMQIVLPSVSASLSKASQGSFSG